MTDLESAAADRLYALLPEQFVAERTALAARAKAEGDPAAAAAIRRLAKPSQPAWQVNLLVRDHPETLDELAAVGAALRAAAQSGDPAAVRRANADRQAVVSRLADRAGRLAADAGKAPTASTRREVESTLQAVLSSPDAAEQVASGRLVAALFDTGLDALGMLTLAPAPVRRPPAASQAAPAAPGAPRGTAGDDGRAAAAQRLQEAQEALREAKAASARARSQSDQLAEEVSQLSARLEAVRRRAEAAAQEAEAAADAEARATRAHEAARGSLEELGDP
jgi:hypothetical protein